MTTVENRGAECESHRDYCGHDGKYGRQNLSCARTGQDTGSQFVLQRSNIVASPMSARKYVRVQGYSLITTNPDQRSHHSRKPFRRLMSLLTTGITKCLIPSTFASRAPLDGPSKGMVMEGISVYVQEESHEVGRQCMSCFMVCPNGR